MTHRDANDAVRKQFGAAAAAYTTSALHAAGPDLALLREAVRLRAGERVLDLGCGAGHSALALAPGAAEVVGIDLAPEMIEAARAQARIRNVSNVRFEVGDAAAPAFGDSVFDVVVSRFSAHHFTNPAAALRETFRVLKTGGTFYLIDTVAPEDPALDTFGNTLDFLRDPSHARNHKASEWVRFLQAAGFAAGVIERLPLPIDGESWVKRTGTPPDRLAVIRRLLVEASPAQRAGFEIRDEPWGFSHPMVIIRAVKPTPPA